MQNELWNHAQLEKIVLRILKQWSKTLPILKIRSLIKVHLEILDGV